MLQLVPVPYILLSVCLYGWSNSNLTPIHLIIWLFQGIWNIERPNGRTLEPRITGASLNWRGDLIWKRGPQSPLHTMQRSEVIYCNIVNYDCIMQSFLTDREDLEDRQVLKFINPVADSDNEGYIFELERSFFVFLSLHLGFMLFPKFRKCWKLTLLKNLIFNTTGANYSILVKPCNSNAVKCSVSV